MSSREAVNTVLKGRRRQLGQLAMTAFLGGFLEALFLVLATRAAFAITSGSDRVGIIAGWFVSVPGTLTIGLLLVALRIASAGLASWLSSRLSTRVVAQTRRRLARAFFNASWATQQRQRGGSLQELMSTFANHTSGLMSGLNQGVVAAANLLALLGLAIAVDPLGALVLVLSVGVLGSFLRPLRAAVRRRSDASARAGMNLATAVNEASELGMELHVFHVQDAAIERIDRLIERSRASNRRLQFASGLATPAYVGLAYLALIAALAFVAASPATSLTSLGASMLVMLRSLSYGQALQTAYVNVASNTPVIAELERQLRVLEGGTEVDLGEPIARVGQIEVRNVSFSYATGQPVLTGITFTIDRREIVGIVGPSGSGKSTLVQLLLGLRRPDTGDVLADGRDIREVRRADWARRVTFVPQEAHLITGTIADNIRFLREGITDPDIERAAQLAHLHDEIVAHPDGYSRTLGAEGGRLSGGQQQRLCIARALVEHPDVLILDEPTSALDVRSEHLVRQTLLHLRQQMTVIVIAHRLSTLDICDRIMVIQEGELVAFDEPARLALSSDFYREALELSEPHHSSHDQ